MRKGEVRAADEHGAVVELCRRPEVRGGDAATLAPLADPAGLEAALRLAAAHRVLGLFASSALAAHDAGQVALADPAHLTDLCRALRRRAALFHLRRDAVVAALHRAGIPVVLLKGIAVAESLYDEPFHREFEDLDILVRRHALDEAVQALAPLGYTTPADRRRELAYLRHHFHMFLEHPSARALEVHWDFSFPGLAFRMDPDAVFAGARPLRPNSPGGAPMVPRPEHMVLHLVLENIQEGFSRLGRLVDLDRLAVAAEGIDWDFLGYEARRGGLAHPTWATVRLARELMHTEIPGEAIAGLRPTGIAAAHLRLYDLRDELLRQSLLAEQGRRDLVEVWMLPGAAARLRHIVRWLRLDPFLEGASRKRRGPIGRVLRVAKLGLTHVAAYGGALRGPHSAHTRF